ncbi:HD domain-containing protein [bacterium]|nr:HD domain-containing protein [bacterium]MBU1024485.1 HD domain-containing protein [bacterium]
MTITKFPDLTHVQNDRRVKLMLEAADRAMEELGYTEHGIRHAMIVSTRAKEIMLEFGFPERQAELVAIAGYLHDVGNLVARSNHAHSSTMIVYPVLIDLGFDYDETFQMLGFIASHEDETGIPTNPMDAAIVIADKSDVHRSRVREWDPMTKDIHDRVNLAATSTQLIPNRNEMSITLDISIDNQISSVMDYLHIFLDRMDMCLSAGHILSAQFQLVINGVKMYKEENSANNSDKDNNAE